MPRAFNTVVNPNMEVKRLPPEEEPGAPGAYGGAGSIDGKIPGRYWINLRTTDAAQQVQPRRPHVPRVDPRPHLAGRVHARDAADSPAAGLQRLLGRAGDSMRSSSPTSSAPTIRITSGGSATCSRSRSAPAAWSSTPASTPSAGRASRASQFFVDVNGSNPEEVASEVDRYCSWPGQACGYKVGPQRDQPAARQGEGGAGARSSI